jgi:hypothetical protein
MGIRNTLKQAAQAMSPENVKRGLEASKNPPSQEEIDANRALMTPEHRAEYDAQVANAEAGRQAAEAAAAQPVTDPSAALRALDGAAGDLVYGKSAEEQNAPRPKRGFFDLVKAELLEDTMDGIRPDLPKHEKDRELAGRIGAEERAQRDAARVPFLAPERWPVSTTRIATRGKTQVEEVAAFLQASGLGARPDLVYGVYRVPDRISQHMTPGSESNRVVEWAVVHGGLPDAPTPTPVHAAYFPALDQWVARRAGEPSVLDEELGLAFLARAGIPAERSLGLARLCNFVQPKDRWFAMGGSGGQSEDHSQPIVPVVEGVLAFHTDATAESVGAQMSAEAPLPVGPETSAGTHIEVLNWGAVAKAVHPRVQHPPAAPSPFPYLPSSPDELLQAYLEVVGVRPTDCYSAQVTIDAPFPLIGRAGFGSTDIGSSQPCADGKDRRRLHGARQVVIAYRDQADYAEGRLRWEQYQEGVLQAHLERGTDARAAIEVDELPKSSLLRGAAKAFDLAVKASEFGEWEPPPPYRYCWPLQG